MTPEPWLTLAAVTVVFAAAGWLSVRARRKPRQAACSRHDPRDPYRMKTADRLAFMDIWARAELDEDEEAGERP